MTWGSFLLITGCCYGLYYAIILLIDLAKSKTAGKLSDVGHNSQVYYAVKEPVKVQAAFNDTLPAGEETVFFEDEMDRVTAPSAGVEKKNPASGAVPDEATEELLSTGAFGEAEGYFINDKAVINHLGLL